MGRFFLCLFFLVLFIAVSGYSYSSDGECNKKDRRKCNRECIEKIKKENKDLKDERNVILKQYIDEKVDREHGGKGYDPFDSYLYKKSIYNKNKK